MGRAVGLGTVGFGTVGIGAVGGDDVQGLAGVHYCYPGADQQGSKREDWTTVQKPLLSDPTPFDVRMPLPASPGQVWTLQDVPHRFPSVSSSEEERWQQHPRPESQCCCSGCPVTSCCDWQSDSSWDCCSKNHRAEDGSAHPVVAPQGE